VTRRYITYQLDRDGHTVAVAEDGRQALEQLSTGDFDMVLMDIQMPVMDGAEAILRIRKGEAGSRNTDIPVIALTAYALSGDRERLLQIGADDYVAKPAEVAQLHAAIARHVSRMQLRRADA
jgi:CheY-like chemotaxis protein